MKAEFRVILWFLSSDLRANSNLLVPPLKCVIWVPLVQHRVNFNHQLLSSLAQDLVIAYVLAHRWKMGQDLGGKVSSTFQLFLP